MLADNTTVITCNYILANVLGGEEFDIKPGSLDIWRDWGSRSLIDKSSQRTARSQEELWQRTPAADFSQDCSSLNHR